MQATPTTADAYRLFHEGTEAFSRAEAAGMRIDVRRLDETIRRVTDRIRALRARLRESEVGQLWRKTYGERMSWGSRPQLGHVLFDLLGVPCPARTRTGRPSTDESTMEKVDHPFVRDYQEVERLAKLRSTNLIGIRRELQDGFLRPFFHLHTVQTMRGSSSDINFQSVPNRIPQLAKLVRRLFIPRSADHKLLEIDLKANEVRVAVCYSGDARLRHDTLEGDMHRDMAAECYLLSPDAVPKGARQAAKGGFVFAEFYGDYWRQVSRNLWEAISRDGLTTVGGRPLDDWLRAHGIRSLGAEGDGRPAPGTFADHIRQVEDRFWNERFSTYGQWRKDWWESYQQTGEFQMLTGFRIRGVYDKNQVLNAPIQGSAFHCLLWVLVELDRWLRKHRMRSLIIGQIHDSIELDVHRDELDDVLAKAFELLRRDIRRAWPWISCPLDGEAEVAETNWYEKRAVEVPQG